MKKISKGTWFTIVLLIVAFLEGMVVFYDLIHPEKDRFMLAQHELDFAAKEVIVNPMPFEKSQVTQINLVFNSIYKEIKENLLDRIALIGEDTKAPLLKDENGNIISEKSEDEISTEEIYGIEDLQEEIEKDLADEVKIDESLSSDDKNAETANENTENEPKATEVAPADESEHEVIKNSAENNVKQMLQNNEVLVAIVIDDMGISVGHTKDIISLKQPMTASFLPYGHADKSQVEEAKNSGFEVMLHVPMMPHVPADLAPVTLSPKMANAEIKDKFEAMLTRFEGEGMKGVNNHMGSLFTETEKSMDAVMEVLKSKNMFFLDSKTTSKSVAKAAAKKYGVPYIARDVFLDNQNDYDYIMKQLRQTEKVAQMRGYAVAICHPRTQTYKALSDWVKTLPEKKIKLVHISDLLKLTDNKMQKNKKFAKKFLTN